MKDSLDPRIKRLDKKVYNKKTSPDQLHTYEVFLQLKSNKPFDHVGVVHAPDLEMAFVFAKEAYSRRYTCSGLWVVNTADVWVTEFTDNQDNLLASIKEANAKGNTKYDVFILEKRGKQHRHAGIVDSSSPMGAITKLFQENPSLFAFNAWVCKSDAIMRSNEELLPIWDSLPDKKFRDAIEYKAGKKLKDFISKK